MFIVDLCGLDTDRVVKEGSRCWNEAQRHSSLLLASNNKDICSSNRFTYYTLSSLDGKMWCWLTVASTMFVILSFVYACLYPSLHTSLVVSTCPILCLLDYLGLKVFDFVDRWILFAVFLLWRLSAWMRVVWNCTPCFEFVLARVICHFVSCCDLGLFVCVFVLIIMGCSLLLSHFLFIVLILAPGSSLTSQGCLRCGNQGKLYLSGVWSHLLTFELIEFSRGIFIWFGLCCWRKIWAIWSAVCFCCSFPSINSLTVDQNTCQLHW